MDICCTRPHCGQPLNSFTDLGDGNLLNTVDQRYCASCGMPLILEGRYVPIKLAQQNESGATFLGRDLHSPRLKYCKIEQIQIDPAFNSVQLEIATKLFHHEAEILDKLGEHPKIPRFFTCSELVCSLSATHPQQSFFYLVQEYIDGENLEQELLSKGKFTELEVISVLREIARTLEFIHFQETIHRNIKPANIIRDLQGKLYLVNFGAVKEIVAETTRITARVPASILNSVFTPEYIPWLQDPKPTIYPSSDLYSLAVTCLNLLTGRQPQDLLDTETNNWQWRTPDLQVSDFLAEILDKMLQNLPANRFQSARDVLDALDTNCGTPILSISATSTLFLGTLPSVFGSLDAEYVPDECTSLQLDSEQINHTPLQPDSDLFQFDENIFQFDEDIFQLDHHSLNNSSLVTVDKAPLSRSQSTIIARKKLWLIVGAFAAGIVGLVAMVIPKVVVPVNSINTISTAISRRSSVGERILLSFEGSRDTDKFKELKRAGVLAISKRNYGEAVTKLQAALIENPNSPETRIYFNNAVIGDRKSYTIAAAAPIERSIDRASEMLRGFAQAQSEMNQAGDVNEPKIKLRIIDDSDDPKVIESISKAIVSQPEILGVIGHNRNDVTVKAANIYDRNKLAFIAPISTANQLTGTNKPYIFRTNAKVETIAEKLINHLVNVDRKRKVAIFYVPTVPYSNEFRVQFTKKLNSKGGKVVAVFPFSSTSASRSSNPMATFDAELHMQKAKQMGAEAVLLLPVGRSSREALKVLKIRATDYPEIDVVSDTALYSLKTLKDGAEAKGLVMGVPWQESEGTAQFVTGAKQLWNSKVNWVTATSYNAVKAIGTAIKAQESPSRAGVMKILSKNEFMGASGRFQFKNGEPTEKYILVMVAKTPPNYKYSSGTGYDFVLIED